MKNKPQHQGSLYEQLIELVQLANKNGLYDASDWILNQIIKTEYNSHSDKTEYKFIDQSSK